MNVFETLARSARQWPDHVAMIDACGPLDYRSLWREVEALRGQLDRLGVRGGQGVGVRARNGRAFVIGALAALGCGAVVMPIHHQLKPDEWADLQAQAPLSAILDDGSGVAQPGRTLALDNPAPETVLRVRMAYLLTEAGILLPKTRPPFDSGFLWTLKPAPLAIQ